MQDEYYTKCLYPFQDGVIKILTNAQTPFYLTGGTALSRAYYHHRFSDDLDFFVNSDDQYIQHVKTIIKNLKEHESVYSYTVDTNSIIVEETFSQVILVRKKVKESLLLSIDLINDSAERVGEIIVDDKMGRVDNILNILSNKITALYRLEPKDIADIWIISQNESFSWKEIT